MSPSRVTKKKLTVAQAADQFERCKRKMAELKPQLEEAEEVLKEHFERTGRSTYRDRIALSTTTRTVLDQAKIRAYFGKKLGGFQKTITVRSLSLLGDEK
jgi:hypothetical protein